MLNVYNGWIMTTLIMLHVIARCDVAAGSGYKTLMEMLMMTRPSILCRTQMSRKSIRPFIKVQNPQPLQYTALGEVDHNKTQFQLCKGLAWPIIPHSWSGFLWKKVSSMDVITLGKSTTIFLSVRLFSAW